jgi:hypothetical protein
MGARMGDQKFLQSLVKRRQNGLLLAYGTVAFLSFVCAGEIVTTHLYCATAVEFLLLR